MAINGLSSFLSQLGGSGGGGDAFGGGGDNADLKAERKAIQRQSLKDSNDALRVNEEKKNIEALR